MRVIIAGGRHINDPELARRAIIESGFRIEEVVCGCARGADQLGFHWARTFGLRIRFFPAWASQHEWALENCKPDEVVETHYDRLGKSAGMARNGAMARYADALIAIWDGKSHGTGGMIDVARRAGLKVHVLLTSAIPAVPPPK